jgi:hypothetical protein
LAYHGSIEIELSSCRHNGQRSPAAAHDHIGGRLVQRLLDGLFEC